MIRGFPQALVVALVSLAFVPSPAAAVPTVDLSWDACSPIVTSKISVPGETTAKLICSVTGMDEVHKAYAGFIVFSTEMPCRDIHPTPDAWRFDVDGCETGLGRIVFTDPTKTCPPLAGVGTSPVFTVSNFHVDTYPSENYLGVQGAMVIQFAAAYPSHPQTPDPGQRYQMARIEFDLQYAVAGAGEPGISCGGLDAPMCFALYTGYQYTVEGRCEFPGLVSTPLNFVDVNSQQKPMAMGQRFATYGLTPGSAMSCFEVTPARPSTWGHVKARYRD